MTRPRIGFLGLGWIGRHRMKAILESGTVEAAAIADPSLEMMVEGAKLAPEAVPFGSLEALLTAGLDGLMIATPSAMHAAQSIRALQHGVAVFCQKPLGRTETEVRAVVEAACVADRLLGVDLSYRFTEGMRQVKETLQAGDLGQVFAIDLAFHNAYGPDKPWFYDPASSGGGCVMDLGVHLVDLVLWALDFPSVIEVTSKLFSRGKPLINSTSQVEDYATAVITLESGAVVRLACSWNLQVGCEAIISATFFGTEGGVALRNLNGSFYDFVAERYRSTKRETLTEPPDAWGGRAAVDWARRLAAREGYDAGVEKIVDVARVLDQIYGR
jgi:predicted dehydrogenase